MVFPENINSDVELATRVLGYARNLAPCVDSLDGEAADEVVAILKPVALAASQRVVGLKSKTVGDWSWTYFSDEEMGSLLGPDDVASLRRLCGVSAVSSRGPVSSFPDPPAPWVP